MPKAGAWETVVEWWVNMRCRACFPCIHTGTREDVATRSPKGRRQLGGEWGTGCIRNELEISPDWVGKRICFNQSCPDQLKALSSSTTACTQSQILPFKDAECDRCQARVWWGFGACLFSEEQSDFSHGMMLRLGRPLLGRRWCLWRRIAHATRGWWESRKLRPKW